MLDGEIAEERSSGAADRDWLAEQHQRPPRPSTNPAWEISVSISLRGRIDNSSERKVVAGLLCTYLVLSNLLGSVCCPWRKWRSRPYSGIVSIALLSFHSTGMKEGQWKQRGTWSLSTWVHCNNRLLFHDLWSLCLSQVNRHMTFTS